MNIFDFLHGDIHQEKVACESTAFSWVCPGMSKIFQGYFSVVLGVFPGKK